MMQPYRLIASFVHGNALGVVLEPTTGMEGLSDETLKTTWQVRIGPLALEAAIGADYPKDDYDAVVRDLKLFCEAHGIDRGIGNGVDK
jgi:hypothetical protein